MKLKVAQTALLTPHRCLKCGARNDAASGIVERHARNTLTPRPGDFMLCLDCCHTMAYADDLSFRELTAEERRALTHDLKFQMAKAALMETIRARIKH